MLTEVETALHPDEERSIGRGGTVPGARGLGRDAEQVAQLEITRIDAVVSGAARGERREADHSTRRSCSHPPHHPYPGRA